MLYRYSDMTSRSAADIAKYRLAEKNGHFFFFFKVSEKKNSNEVIIYSFPCRREVRWSSAVHKTFLELHSKTAFRLTQVKVQNFFHQNILKATEVTTALVIQNGPLQNNGYYVIGSFITLMYHLVNVDLILITFSTICMIYHINLSIVFCNDDFNVEK